VTWKLFPPFDATAVQYKSKIIDCQVRLKGEDSTGAVKEGKVIIRGRLRQVQAPPSTGEYFSDVTNCKASWSWHRWAVNLSGIGRVKYALDWTPDPKKATDPTGPELRMYMLLLGLDGDRERRDPDDPNKYYDLSGLLLYPIGDQFLRVGIFLISHIRGAKPEYFDDAVSQVVTII
jgi:hypothetical protein